MEIEIETKDPTKKFYSACNVRCSLCGVVQLRRESTAYFSYTEPVFKCCFCDSVNYYYFIILSALEHGNHFGDSRNHLFNISPPVIKPQEQTDGNS